MHQGPPLCGPCPFSQDECRVRGKPTTIHGAKHAHAQFMSGWLIRAESPGMARKIDQPMHWHILGRRRSHRSRSIPELYTPPLKTIRMNAALPNGHDLSNASLDHGPLPFTQSDYDEFRSLIEMKLAEARATLDLLHQTLHLDRSNGTDDTYSSSNIQEDGQATLEREEAAHMAERQEKFIQQLQAALVRIQNRTYGICRVTGKPIAKERLRIVPHATLSMEAKKGN